MKTVYFAVFMISLLPSIESLNPELRRTQLIGTWVGYERGCACFYYLVLEENGSGRCRALYFDNTANSYKVEKWAVETDRLLLKLFPITKTAEKITITVDFFDALSMDLELTGPTRGWHRKATLYKESELNARMRKCRDLDRSRKSEKP
jgi:hypothetical protein